MNIYVACAEHDKSCPYGWRLAIDCVYLGGAERDKSRPYGSRLALLNLFVFCEFYLYHLQLSKKTFIFVTKFHHHIMLCSLSPLPRSPPPRHTQRQARIIYPRIHHPYRRFAS